LPGFWCDWHRHYLISFWCFSHFVQSISLGIALSLFGFGIFNRKRANLEIFDLKTMLQRYILKEIDSKINKCRQVDNHDKASPCFDSNFKMVILNGYLPIFTLKHNMENFLSKMKIIPKMNTFCHWNWRQIWDKLTRKKSHWYCLPVLS